MFAKLDNGSALCLAAYGDIQKGAIVPPVNELWAQVVECDVWGEVPSDIEQRRERQRQMLKMERIERVSAPINNVQVATPEDRENVQWAASNVESIDWI